jgi:ABC-type transport system involved in cytochrome bd biosynthesis fused ATPase/permease subunit
VLFQCHLEPDLALFDAGDETEIGEQGLTLSGGQRARVTLARAIYSSAKIILLDDILAALDVHTAAWIVRNCLSGDLVTGRTVIMVVWVVSDDSACSQSYLDAQRGDGLFAGQVHGCSSRWSRADTGI